MKIRCVNEAECRHLLILDRPRDLLDQIYVFAGFKLKMLARFQILPTQGRHVHLEDKPGERRMCIATRIGEKVHSIERFYSQCHVEHDGTVGRVAGVRP